MREGEKSYEYGWLDKAIRVTENGRELAKFEYRNNGQLARAMRGNDIETFEWDGLALTERNGTKYINEPHAGGGNPILATTSVPNANSLTSPSQSQTIFTDILGTSIGYVKDGKYSDITKISFGADTSDKSSFFTDKPYVDGLGYAFLLRNYRPDMGKWQISDIIGYPDGWNNFAYCNNIANMAIDYLGTVLSYPPSMQGTIDILYSTSSGQAIINQLRNSSNIHTITESASGRGSTTSATNDANAMNGKGSGSTISMDNFNSTNSSPDGSGRNRPYELGVMHE